MGDVFFVFFFSSGGSPPDGLAPGAARPVARARIGQARGGELARARLSARVSLIGPAIAGDRRAASRARSHVGQGRRSHARAPGFQRRARRGAFFAPCCLNAPASPAFARPRGAQCARYCAGCHCDRANSPPVAGRAPARCVALRSMARRSRSRVVGWRCCSLVARVQLKSAVTRGSAVDDEQRCDATQSRRRVGCFGENGGMQRWLVDQGAFRLARSLSLAAHPPSSALAPSSPPPSSTDPKVLGAAARAGAK